MPKPALPEVEKCLSEVFDTAVTISSWDHVLPWSVARCQLTGPARSEIPASVVVKWLRDDPNGFRTDPQQMCTELAALEFLADLGVDLAPRLLASDLAASFLVLEDLSPMVPLNEIILRNGATAAADALSLFARTLGELNGATVGCADAYYTRRCTYGPVDPRAERLRFVGRATHMETKRLLDALGVAMPAKAEREWAEVLESMSDPGPFLALSNGDAGTNNFLVDGARGRLTDFEAAGFRHAVTDAACLAVPGPLWITVSDPAATGLEQHYRAALSRTVPEAADDRLFGAAMAAACLVMAHERLGGFARVDTRPAGDDSRVQRIFTLESAADTAERHRCFPHLTGWTRRVAQALRRRWTDADLDRAGFQPYTPRTRT